MVQSIQVRYYNINYYVAMYYLMMLYIFEQWAFCEILSGPVLGKPLEFFNEYPKGLSKSHLATEYVNLDRSIYDPERANSWTSFDGKPYIHQLICRDHYMQNETTHKNVSINIEYYDTLNTNDVVKEQYSLLPYPPIKKQDLEDEKNYYNSPNGTNSVYPRHLAYDALKLENLNRILFKGKNRLR